MASKNGSGGQARDRLADNWQSMTFLSVGALNSHRGAGLQKAA